MSFHHFIIIYIYCAFVYTLLEISPVIYLRLNIKKCIDTCYGLGEQIVKMDSFSLNGFFGDMIFTFGESWRIKGYDTVMS